jgi:hypothetical protein
MESKEYNPNLDWEDAMEVFPKVKFLSEDSLEFLEEAVDLDDFCKKDKFSNELLDAISVCATTYNEELQGGITPRDHELFLPSLLNLIKENKKIDKKLKNDLKYGSGEYDFVYHKSKALQGIIYDLEDSGLMRISYDTKGHVEGFYKGTSNFDHYQTLRTKGLSVKRGLYVHTESSSDKDIISFLMDYVVKGNGLFHNIEMAIEEIEDGELFLPKNLESDILFSKDFEKEMNRIKRYYENVSKDTSKDSAYSFDKMRFSEFSAQVNRNYIFVGYKSYDIGFDFCYDNNHVSGLEVKISSPDESRIDGLFDEVKRISHGNSKRK